MRAFSTIGSRGVPGRDRAAVTWSFGSGQEVPVLPASRHGVDNHLVAAGEDEDDGLEQARLGVEAEPQFAVRQVVLVERFDQSGQSAAWTASCVSIPCLGALA